MANNQRVLQASLSREPLLFVTGLVPTQQPGQGLLWGIDTLQPLTHPNSEFLDRDTRFDPGQHNQRICTGLDSLPSLLASLLAVPLDSPRPGRDNDGLRMIGTL
jgi:hypothetical protein